MTRRQQVVIRHDGEHVWSGDIEDFARDLGVREEAIDLYMDPCDVVFADGHTERRTVSIETWNSPS